MELTDRVALVTGAAGAVGGAVARRFVAEGARVLLTDEDAGGLDQLCRDLAGAADRIASAAADPSSERDARALVERAIGRFGAIDVLVKAAGAPEEPPWDEPGPEVWARRMRQLAGCALCCQAVAPAMIEKGRGRIVNVAASAGRYRSAYSPPEGVTGTGAASAAVGGGMLALTRELALELDPRGVTVNAIAPSSVPSARGWREFEALPAELRERVIAETPLRRFAQAEEIAGIAVFLASDDASYVTGATIVANGGWCAA